MELIVAERMSRAPYYIHPEASVDEALALMRQHGVRHLPVLEGERLVGLVTDTQLSVAWFPSLLSDLIVREVMTADPLCISPDATVYQAARLIYHNRITGLPVLEEGRLVGIITMADMLKTFVDLLGLLTESVRLEVALRAGDDALEEVHHLIHSHGAEVISVARLASHPERRVYSFRLRMCDLEPIVADLSKAGHQVIS